MNDQGIARIKYYKGQTLTAQDFEDQQAYHSAKLSNLLQRFPVGIIGGLEVEARAKGDDAADFDHFYISPGFAVDEIGNQIIVLAEGYKIPVTEFMENRIDDSVMQLYLSAVFTEKATTAGSPLCNSNGKSNRILETFTIVWDTIPNVPPHITLALIELKEDKVRDGTKYDDFEVKLVDDSGGPRVRLDAAVVGTDQINDSAVTQEKIANEAVTLIKLAPDAKLSLTQDIVTSYMITDADNEIKADDPTGYWQGTDSEKTPGDIDSTGIKTPHIQNGAVTSIKISKADTEDGYTVNGSNENAQFLGAGTGIKTDHIKNNAIASAKIAENAVTGRELSSDAGIDANRAVDTDHIKDNAITSAKIAENAVMGRELLSDAEIDANRAVDTDHIKNNAITSAKIAENAVTGRELSSDAGIDANRAVDTDHIKDNAITSAKIAENAVTGRELLSDAEIDANRAVDTDHIKDNAIASAKIAENAVTGRELLSDAEIDANRAVGMDHIKDNAITSPKIAEKAVTSRELLSDARDDSKRAVSTDHIKFGAVTLDKLSVSTFSVIPESKALAPGETEFIAFAPRGLNGWVLDFDKPMIGWIQPDPKVSFPDGTILTSRLGFSSDGKNFTLLFEITYHNSKSEKPIDLQNIRLVINKFN